ncbi:hypothetical protein EHT45_10510 [Salmonella enterica]|nr:hypothetical protein [Salmonella enterica]
MVLCGWKSEPELLYPSVNSAGDDPETCCNAENRMKTINNLFYCFKCKLFEITLTTHAHLF